jgi:molybdenum cofactor cytidylyltransferase
LGNIGAVVLAAGLSKRFGGESKLMADLGGEPLVRHAVRAVAGSGLADVVVVTGREADACREALRDLPVRFVHNPKWEDGMGSSIASGVAALDGDLAGAFIVPGDMPFITPDLLQSLIAAFHEGREELAIFPSSPSGEQRAPVLWPRRLLPRLRSLSGTEGGKALLKSIAGDALGLTIADQSLLTDVDTAEDMDAARQHLHAVGSPAVSPHRP